MATTHPLTAEGEDKPDLESLAQGMTNPENAAVQAENSAQDGHETTSAQALVPVSPDTAEEAEPFPFSAAVMRLPVEVDVVLPVREFRVRHLLTLDPGQVIESEWRQGDAVPLTAGDVQLAWSEFEVIDEKLAVRVTRLP